MFELSASSPGSALIELRLDSHTGQLIGHLASGQTSCSQVDTVSVNAPQRTVITFAGVGEHLWDVPSVVRSVEVLVVGGGASGARAGAWNAPGGGAGGLWYAGSHGVIPGNSVHIVVGDGGASNSPITNIGVLQSDSRFRYTRWAKSGLIYTVWTSPDLKNWTEDTSASQVAAEALNGVATVTVTVTTPPNHGRLFVRVQATEAAADL